MHANTAADSNTRMVRWTSCTLLRTTVILSFLLLGACSTMVSREDAMNQLTDSAVCCSTLKEAPISHMESGKSTEIRLDATSPAFAFATGKSYFSLIELPHLEAGVKIRVQSFALGEHIDKAHIFFPQLSLLDGDFSVLAESRPDTFVMSKASFKETAAKTWGLPVKLEGEIAIGDKIPRYLLLYTTDELTAATTPYVVQRFTSIIFPGIVTAIPTYKERILIPHSPYGLLFLDIMDAQSGEAPQPGP